MKSACRYRDRETGLVKSERVFPERMLRFLYEHPFGRALRYLVLQRRLPSRLYGWIQRRPDSRRRIPVYVEKLGIDVSEAERPWESYRTVDEFFTRRLRPGARPVDADPEHLISPADGCVLAYPRLQGEELAVKRCRVPLRELLGEPELAERFRAGMAVVIRLRPVDYHRFHFPDSGVASAASTLGKHLHSVHPIALAAGAPSFLNKRMITRLSSRGFGEILIIEVGALSVGSIVQTYEPGPVERGQEKGFFRIGGSALVLLLEPGRVRLDDDLIESSADDLETFVKFGTRIGRRA